MTIIAARPAKALRRRQALILLLSPCVPLDGWLRLERGCGARRSSLSLYLVWLSSPLCALHDETLTSDPPCPRLPKGRSRRPCLRRTGERGKREACQLIQLNHLYKPPRATQPQARDKSLDERGQQTPSPWAYISQRSDVRDTHHRRRVSCTAYWNHASPHIAHNPTPAIARTAQTLRSHLLHGAAGIAYHERRA